MADVVTLGDINVDIVARHPSYPTKGADALSLATEIRSGGSAANTVVALAQLGIDASFIGCVGTDALAQMLVESLADVGVDESGLQRDPNTTTGLMYIVVTPDGERTIHGCRGANVQTDPTRVPLELVSGARVFHLSGYALLAEPQRSAALLSFRSSVANDLTTVFDPGMSLPGVALTDAHALLPGVDILLPNLAEAQHLTGETAPEDCARALLKAGVRVVLTKLGADGCWLAREDRSAWIPGFSIQPQDSTGAGDSFAAGVIASALGGLDWECSALLGNAMGALTAGRGAGATKEPLPAQALALLRSGQHDPRLSEWTGALTRTTDYVEMLILRKNKGG